MLSSYFILQPLIADIGTRIMCKDGSTVDRHRASFYTLTEFYIIRFAARNNFSSTASRLQQIRDMLGGQCFERIFRPEVGNNQLMII